MAKANGFIIIYQLVSINSKLDTKFSIGYHRLIQYVGYVPWGGLGREFKLAAFLLVTLF